MEEGKGTQISQGKGKEHAWPNTRPEKLDDNEDSIDNGTDYNKRSGMSKSFADHVMGNDVVMQGVASNTFLLEMTKSVGRMFEDAENRLAKSIDSGADEADTFSKSLGGDLSSLSKSYVELDARIEALGTQGPEAPVIPISRTEFLRKSAFGEEAPSHQQIMDTLFKGFQSGSVSQLDIIKFESTGELDTAAVEFINKSLSAQA